MEKITNMIRANNENMTHTANQPKSLKSQKVDLQISLSDKSRQDKSKNKNVYI